MTVYWLPLLPLLAAALCGVAREQRRLALIVSAPTAFICANVVLSLPVHQPILYVGLEWVLDPLAQQLLAFMYIVTGLLLLLAALSRLGQGLYAPVWASVGLLSAVVLINSPLVSLLLLSMALALVVLAALPRLPSGLHGASMFLAWIMLPIPFIIASFALLDRFAALPTQTWLVPWAAWALVPAVVFWLTLFPLHDTTRAWAQDGSFVAPMFLWLVKDVIVLFLLFTLWQRNPLLDLAGIRYALSLLALLTVIAAGVSALIFTSPSAVLACAATSAFGLAVQGLMTGTPLGVMAALMLLIVRAVALLLGGAALACPVRMSFSAPEGSASFSWRKLAVIASFSIAVLLLAGLPQSMSFDARTILWSTLRRQEPYALTVWSVTSIALAVAWGRTTYRLWRSRLVFLAGSGPNVLALVTLSLLLLCLVVAFYPDLTAAWIARYLPYLLPANAL